MDAPRLIEPVARALLGEPNRRLSSKGELRFGSHGSLSIDLAKGTYFDHEANAGGGVLDLIARQTGLRGPDAIAWLREQGLDPDDGNGAAAPHKRGNGHREPIGKPIAHYDYTDERAALISQVVRFEPKTFRQRRRARPDDDPGKVHDGWIWTTRGVRPVPYRLPDLIEHVAAEHFVFVVEGEKDADNLCRLGVTATTNAGGVGKWASELNHFFTGADVIVIADNDPQAKGKDGAPLVHPDGRPRFPGQDHAREVCRQLAGTAARVRYFDLKQWWPDCPPKGDISDWIAAGGTIERLNEIVAELPDWSADLPAPETELPRLAFVAVRLWQDQPVPQRRWQVREVMPASNVTLLSGEGGVGKTLLAQQLAVATVLGMGWVTDYAPEPGPVLLISAEDDEAEMHYRLAAIVDHYGAQFRDLADLHVLSLAGKDAVLAAVGQHSIVKATGLFEQLCRTVREIRPRWIGIDTAADVFVVDERDRSQARQCISLLRGLALDLNTAILLLSHPSLTGIATGTGLSGSTAWNNSVRSRLYLRSPKKDDDDADGDDARILELMKSNYSAKGTQVRLHWRDGVLIPDNVTVQPRYETARQERIAREVFLTVLRRFNATDRTASDKPSAVKNFAPRLFAEEPEARALAHRKSERQRLLHEAMISLFAEQPPKIELVMGPLKTRPSERHLCLYATGILL
jgi:RecA-family ATPase